MHMCLVAVRCMAFVVLCMHALHNSTSCQCGMLLTAKRGLCAYTAVHISIFVACGFSMCMLRARVCNLAGARPLRALELQLCERLFSALSKLCIRPVQAISMASSDC
jgi:hypothetical protein